MKKKVFGRQFKRDTNERKALFKGLMTSLVMLESIKTTEQKAKAIRAQVEKLVTKAKTKREFARQFIQPYVSSDAVEKIIKDLAVRFADRPGGYTRIIKLENRFSDNAEMAIIEWVVKGEKVEKVAEDKKTKSKKENEVVEAKIAEPKNEKAVKGEKKVTPKKKEQRPPSKAEMEKRSAGKGSPKKESK